VTKKIKIILSLAIFFALIIFGVIFLLLAFSRDYDATGLPVYFFDASGGRLNVEYKPFPQGDFTQQTNATLRYFTNAFELPPLFTFREIFSEIYLLDGLLVANFSHLYSELSSVDEMIFRSAFTLTMTGLPFIDGVKFVTHAYDEGRIETVATIANSPFISPARRTPEVFTLFFADETGEGLITVVYHAADVDTHRRSLSILELLIEGQSDEGILPLIPPETRVREVLIEPEAGIYVNLSGEFHRGFSGTPTQARLMLQSVAHTMLENNKGSARRVFFLIDSERREDFHGVSDFNLGFTIDETKMLGYEAEEAE
jgi:hypothetical protein